MREQLPRSGEPPMLTTKMCLACNREYTDEVERCPRDGTVLIGLQAQPDWFNAQQFTDYEFLAKGRYTCIGKATRRSDNHVVVLKSVPSAEPEILQKYHNE